MTRRFIAIGLIAVAPAVARAQHVHPPASGEQLGSVHFPTSCSPRVSAHFDRAVALLHSFEFGAAIKGFEQVAAADSTCAMAYWGLALSRWSNPMAAGNRSPDLLRQGRLAAASAKRLSPGVTAREQGYIDAVAKLYEDFERIDQPSRFLAYERAMSELAARNPTDTEAQIFHAIALAASAPPTDKTYANQRRAGRILEPLWEKQPNHPGLAHYIIHSYDFPPLAAEAAAAARRYAAIAPSAAHALHMPSHTFTRIGLWRESIATNLRSVDVALGTGAIGEALHAYDYAAYAYLQLRRDTSAKAVMEKVPALAARFDITAITGAAPPSAGVFAIAAIPARYVLERRAWKEAAQLEPKSTPFPWSEAMTYFARSLGASHTGDRARARSSIDSLVAIRDRLAAKGEPYWTEQVEIQRLGAQAWLDLAEGRKDAALAAMREAATREDATEKSAVTPGPLAPARELLGDMLMQLGKPAEALSEYRKTLTREPNRYRAIDGAARAAAAAGDRSTEIEFRTKLRTLTSG
jgi:tetratricopeptide (TPR) repeat protein